MSIFLFYSWLYSKCYLLVLDLFENKIVEKYAPIKHEFDFKTDLLYKKCDTIDKYKIELDWFLFKITVDAS